MASFRLLELLYAALIDPARRERAAVGTLVTYLLLWTCYAVVAKSSQDIHVDMAELIVWSRDLAFGFRKHPPLAAIVVSLWFDIFPIASWSYYLLSVSTATLTLWIVWRLSADYLDAEKRVLGVSSPHTHTLLQFPRAYFQCEHDPHAVMGGDDPLVPAII